MKKKRLQGYSTRVGWTKLLRVMKLSVFLILILVIDVSASVFSQNSKVSVNVENGTLSEIFSKIEEHSEYRFFYQNEQIKNVQRKSVEVKDESISDLVESLLDGTGLSYNLVDRNIIVFPESGNNSSSIGQQKIKLSGKVTDTSGQTLPGVTVVVKGTTNGAITNFDGVYTLSDVPSDGIVLFSFVGMKMQEIPVEGKTSINVIMEEDAIGIEEVVAIGYGTVNRRDLTGSVSSIKTDELTQSTATSFSEALQGRLAGVRVNTSSGEPGAAINIQIRGANSINAGTQPLYIIDGIQLDVNADEVATSAVGGSSQLNPLATIPAEDIESIEILKDASSAAIYGARGANGVIIVTTKSGKRGEKTKFTVSSEFNISEITKGIEMLGGQDYINYRYSLSPTSYAYGVDTDDDEIPDSPVDATLYENHNWQDELFRMGSTQRYNLSMQGGFEKTNWSGGIDYLDQGALVKNNNYKSYSARFKFDHQASRKLKVGFSANWGKTVNSGVASSGGGDGNWNGLIQAVYTYRPVLLASETEEDPVSLESMIFDSYKNTDFNRVLGNTYAQYEITKSLKLRVSGGGSLTSSKLSEFYGANTIWGRNANGRARLRHTQTSSLFQTTTLDYSKKIRKDHLLKAMAGFETNSYKFETFLVRNLNYEDQSTGVFDISKGLVSETPLSAWTQTNRMSWFGRLNYNIKQKYLFTGTLRADGSSNFGKGNKFGYFPSLAFAWRINQESFLKEVDEITNLKLRLSYGITGNDRIPPYQSLATITPTRYASNGQISYGASPTSSENPELKWETTEQYNAGLDFGILNNRIEITADAYYKRTYDMLLKAQVASQIGFISQWKNIGEIENKGIELAINTVNIASKNFNWNTSLNIYANRNKVLSLEGSDEIIVSFPYGYITDVGIVREGEPLGTAYGYEWDGIYQIDDFTWQNDSDPTIPHEDRTYALKEGVTSFAGTTVKPGVFKYKDLGNDGVVSADKDRKIISNSNPKFAGGISNRFKYKNISLDLFFEGVYGNEIFNAFHTRVQSGSGDESFNLTKDYWENRWTPENPSNRYSSTDRSNTDNLASSYFVEDGSYLRFKTLSISYDIKSRLLKKMNIENIRIYGTIDNIHVWTNYSGFDPDVSSHNNLLPGYDRLAYPRARTYTFGFNLTLK